MDHKERTRRRLNNMGRQKCALLNNIKWRKILSVLSPPDTEINRVLVSYTNDCRRFFNSILPHKEDIAKDHIRDAGLWGSGGPVYYDEIYEIRIPFLNKDNYYYQNNFSKEEGKRVFGMLQELGELPIEISDDCIIIKGYSNLSSSPKVFPDRGPIKKGSKFVKSGDD
ncbi:MAG: hypothetical protein COA45_11035 [Zetaproteobacteria bacterium]|nr:MAG: hypothetical protein COA45_11035 [Zetaproteobacteria bacterium]